MSNSLDTVASVAIGHAMNLLQDARHDGNLVSYGKAAMVMPECLVDETCATSEMLEATLQTLLSVYAGYYFRAFTMHNISIGGASIAKRLDKFSTARSTWSSVPGLEEFDKGLPKLKEIEDDVTEDLEDLIAEGQRIEREAVAMMQVANEGLTDMARKANEKAADAADALKNSHKNTVGAALGTMSPSKALPNTKSNTVDLSMDVADVTGPVNFAEGLTLNLRIMENDQTVVVPVNIRLNAMYMAPAPLVSILGFSANDISFGARFKKWRMGGINFWRDLVLCQDLIDEHKKNINSDKTGVYLRMMNRRKQNATAALITGEGSANSSSGIVVLSEEAAAALEMKAGGRLDDYRFRERIFQQGYCMIFAVISQKRGRVRFYTRSIPEYTDVTERDMRASQRGGSGPDVSDILAAFRAGSSFRV